MTVLHCTAETRDDGRGANHNARLFAGVKKSPVRLSPGSAAVQVPDEIGVDPRDLVLRPVPRPRPDDGHAARLDPAQPRRDDDRRRRRVGQHRHDEPRVRRGQPRLPDRDAARRASPAFPTDYARRGRSTTRSPSSPRSPRPTTIVAAWRKPVAAAAHPRRRRPGSRRPTCSRALGSQPGGLSSEEARRRLVAVRAQRAAQPRRARLGGAVAPAAQPAPRAAARRGGGVGRRPATRPTR